MSRKFGAVLNSVSEPHKRESYVGRVSTVGDGGKSISVTNMNNSQLRDLIPIMPYGIASSPPCGLMAYVLVAQDCSKNGIIGVYDPNKPTVKPGECAIYSSDGAIVKCSKGRVTINGRDVLREIDMLKTQK